MNIKKLREIGEKATYVCPTCRKWFDTGYILPIHYEDGVACKTDYHGLRKVYALEENWNSLLDALESAKRIIMRQMHSDEVCDNGYNEDMGEWLSQFEGEE